MKLVLGDCSDSTYQLNRISKFKNAYNYFATVKLFKERNHVNLSYFSERVDSFQVDHDHLTRFSSAGNLITPRFNHTKSFGSFLFGSINAWNKLPGDVRMSNSLELFKAKSKNFWINS